jgi:hypothetical protein
LNNAFLPRPKGIVAEGILENLLNTAGFWH